MKSIRAWLGIDALEESEFAPLRETLVALDHLEPHRARLLAAFAYLLGRVARADLQVSTEETRNLLFGGTANFLVARAELRIDQPDLVSLRLSHKRHLPGMSRE